MGSAAKKNLQNHKFSELARRSEATRTQFAKLWFCEWKKPVNVLGRVNENGDT